MRKSKNDGIVVNPMMVHYHHNEETKKCCKLCRLGYPSVDVSTTSIIQMGIKIEVEK